MAYAWTEGLSRRKDRYLDWLAQLKADQDRRRPPGQGPAPVDWCSVLIKVFEEDFLGNLERLLASEQAGSVVRMIDLERDRAESIIAGKEQPSAGNREFYVYLPESKIYEDDEFATNDYYEIIFAGPPIAGLKFKPPRPAAETPSQRGEVSEPVMVRGKMPKPAVAVGIIDDGIGFANERFRNEHGCRIEELWLQDIEIADGASPLFGTRLTKADIDAFLEKNSFDEVAVYRETGQMDFAKDGHKATAMRISHGTHVMDLACGADPLMKGNDQFAPPICAVQLPADVTLDTSGTMLGSYALQALRFIMNWADKMDPTMPLVVNFSYGTIAGSKDGSQLIEREIDRLTKQREANGGKTFVVLPAGNSNERRANARMEIKSKGSETLDWMVLPDDRTPSYLEIWLDEGTYDASRCPIDVSVTPPVGPSGPKKMPLNGQMVRLQDDKDAISGVYYDLVDGLDGKQRPRVFIAVNPTAILDDDMALAPFGKWSISVKNATKKAVKLSLSIQRDDTPAGYRTKGRQSYFEHGSAFERDQFGDYTELSEKHCPITPEGTLNAIGNGETTIVVGAVENGTEFEPADYTSSGPTPRKKGPRLSAIADEGPATPGTLAAGTFSGTVIALSGTSVAAPQVARYLAEAIAQKVVPIEKLGLRQAREALLQHLATLATPSADKKRIGDFVMPKIEQPIPLVRRII